MRDAKDIALELLKEPTERDKQSKVGASNFSQPCARCLADALSMGQESDNSERPYWAGAVMGTAVHNFLDHRVQVMHPEWEPEQKVVLGELPDYGVIKSTLDLYIPEDFHVIDWKTTTKAKLPAIKEAALNEPSKWDTTPVQQARYKVVSYLYQLYSYGRGLTLAGKRVDWVSAVFICRDGTGDKDIWPLTRPYDHEAAERAWNRLERLWDALRNGLDPATLPSDPNCYHCTVYRD